MARILLVRHAEASGDDADDPGLSAAGRLQALQLAEALAGLDVGAVMHGPRLRTRETADIVQRVVRCEILPMDSLDDRTPFPTDDRWNDYPPDRWDWLQQVPVAERDPGGAGLSAAWTDVCSRAREREILVVVTHAFVVGWFVSLAINGTPRTWTHLAVSNAAITEIELRPSGHSVLHRFNDVAHLQP